MISFQCFFEAFKMYKKFVVNFRGCCHFSTICNCTNHNTDLKLCGFTPLDDHGSDFLCFLLMNY